MSVEFVEGGLRFIVESSDAAAIELAVFAGDEVETRHAMQRIDDVRFEVVLPRAGEGTRYGFRAHGEYAPDHGLWFDPSKLLMDPHATQIDRSYQYDARLTQYGFDTASLMPKAVVVRKSGSRVAKPPLFKPGGLVYEAQVKALTFLHPQVPEAKRGTISALGEPAIIEHLVRLGVDAIELMPVTAWIDERHLPPLGLTNAWGYNPVSFMALDPRLAPGGIADLRSAVQALREAGIGVILDLVFNHTGESDRFGPTLSLRGLDNRVWYRHAESDPGLLVNDTGCGNTVACDHQRVRALIVDSLRHFVEEAGVDGFRFDLAPIMARSGAGFDRNATIFSAISDDPVLGDRIMIAEPWDIGPDGYQLGNFPDGWLEWNDRYRDDLRRYWQGAALPGELATRLAGSSDIFARNGNKTRSVNFLAAHDGFSLADIVAYEHKHNEANGENNRDGHNTNHSWNNGVEGKSEDAVILARRKADIKALLSSLFLSRGTVMLCAGDEFAKSRNGNNNAYCQDNEINWLDWEHRDLEIENHVVTLSAIRRQFDCLREQGLLSGEGNPRDVEWLRADGNAMHPGDWEKGDLAGFAMVLDCKNGQSVVVMINQSAEPVRFQIGKLAKTVDARSVALEINNI